MRIETLVYFEVDYFLTHDERDSDNNELRSSFELQLLLESYKSYLFAADSAYIAFNCCLQTLRFAQKANTSIIVVLDDSTMSCKCFNILTFHLKNLHKNFTIFLKVRVFDFYFQSLWVFESHILKMIKTLFYYDLRLFNYRNYVDVLLHAYNVLRQFIEFSSISLLKTLCNKLADIAFFDERSTRNFKSCYVRFIDDRLRFNSHTSDHKDCHSMIISSHVVKVTVEFELRKNAHDLRFDYRKISLFHHIKERDYHLDNVTWDRVYNLNNTTSESEACHKKATKTRSCSHHSHVSNDLTFCSFIRRLQALRTALLADFIDSVSIAELNLLEIYLACVRIISLISDRYHDDKARLGQNCLCFVDALLAAADRCKDGEWRGQVFGCRELVEICREVIGGLGGREVEEFLWKGF